MSTDPKNESTAQTIARLKFAHAVVMRHRRALLATCDQFDAKAKQAAETGNLHKGELFSTASLVMRMGMAVADTVGLDMDAIERVIQQDPLTGGMDPDARN